MKISSHVTGRNSHKRQIPSIAFRYFAVVGWCWFAWLFGAPETKMKFFLAACATEADCKSTCPVCGKPRPSGHSSGPRLHSFRPTDADPLVPVLLRFQVPWMPYARTDRLRARTSITATIKTHLHSINNSRADGLTATPPCLQVYTSLLSLIYC